MKTKTAVQWLVEQVNSDCLNSTFIRPELFSEAIAMESKQLDDAFKLGLEYGNETKGNKNNLDKIEVYDILKNLLSIDDNLIANNPNLLNFIENTYMQLNKAENMTMDILRNLKKEDIISPEMVELLKIVKSKLYDK